MKTATLLLIGFVLVGLLILTGLVMVMMERIWGYEFPRLEHYASLLCHNPVRHGTITELYPYHSTKQRSEYTALLANEQRKALEDLQYRYT